MTNKPGEWIIEKRITTRLSVAIILIDDFTNKREISGTVRVAIPDKNLTAIKNPGNYYNFLDIPDGTYTFHIDPELYLKEIVENSVLPRETNYHLASPGIISGSTSALLSSTAGLRNGDVLEFENTAGQKERRIIAPDPDPATNIIYWDKDPRGGVLYSYDVSSTVKIPFPLHYILPVTLKPNYLYPFPSGITIIRGSVLDSQANPFDNAFIEVSGEHYNTRTSHNGDFVLYFPATREDGEIQMNITPEGQGVKNVIGRVKKGKTETITIIYP